MKVFLNNFFVNLFWVLSAIGLHYEKKSFLCRTMMLHDKDDCYRQLGSNIHVDEQQELERLEVEKAHLAQTLPNLL